MTVSELIDRLREFDSHAEVYLQLDRIFGHIHGGAGMFENGSIRFVNAAYLNERYKPLEPAGKVRIIDL